MIENKVNSMDLKKVGLVATIAASIVTIGSGCGGADECQTQNYKPRQKIEQNLEGAYKDNSKKYDNTFREDCANGNCCDDGCSYDSEKDCCWCPD
ncbi:hypothetical protein HY636_04780 [Candidatus Woesearchaeota archaeon]|nr:hypothetical protein [Candidatus Woesearchaeota archaeon]